jgi:catechol 2,3-dioxygenase-like lactoylglutathione lyase family enzyme
VIPPISRRDALRALPGIAAASKLFAKRKRQLPVKTLSHVTLRVSDPKRSIEFYQGLFGLPVQAYQGPGQNSLPTLRIGAGPQFLLVYGNEETGIDHFCMTTPDFKVDRVTEILAEHGSRKPTHATKESRSTR